MSPAVAGRYVGSRVTRVEDDRLLTGKGAYIADLDRPGLLHAAFLRSPMPHARVNGIDVSAARRLPGVVAVMTGDDMKRLTNPILNLGMMDGLYCPLYWALAIDRVRMVGDPLAIVIAESRYIAEDALELIEVDYDALEAVATIEQALDPTKPKLWDRADSNVLATTTKQYGDVAGVFASADRVITRTFTSHRQSNQPMETKGCVAEVDPVTRELTFHSATQNTHGLKWFLGLTAGRQSVAQSVAWLLGHREKVRRFARGARKFLSENGESLSSFESAGVMHQLRREPATLPHLFRSMLGLLAKDGTRVPEVEAQDIGGAFGCKGIFSREEIAVCAAAIELGRSIKYVEDRNEHLAVGGQAREEQMRISAAVNNDGEILAFRIDLTMADGAYAAQPVVAVGFALVIQVMIPGTLRLRALECNARVVSLNKGPYVPYRGPWAMETWVRERMLDVVARELGMSPAEIRLRNMVAPAELPRPMITGPMLDVTMSARTTLEKAIQIADLDAFSRAQERARAEGRLLGIGIATYHEAAPGPPGFMDFVVPGAGMEALISEPAHAVLEADGSVSVYLQQMPHGQSHQTTFAQVAADELGVNLRDVNVRVGNTRVTPVALGGTAASRAAAMAGGAVTYSSRSLRSQILERAAGLLEADPHDLQITDGAIHVAGVPSIAVSFADVADDAGDELIEARSNYTGPECGWAMATHVCWVDIDPDTGFVTIPRYVVVEDCGELINPAIVEGQVRGGVAQGVGAVLYERCAYDDDANLQSGTFMDYLIPTAMEIPEIEVHHIETPSTGAANYRGVGEGGMIGSPAAITNAIEDALAHLGVTITEQHLPPSRILELIGVIPAA